MRDTAFVCVEGTRVQIPAGVFVLKKSGAKVSGIIQFYVTEYYSLSDILCTNLTTKADANLLETAGMINISVFSGLDTVVLKDGAKIKLSIPSMDYKPEMYLFSGVKDKMGLINWSLQNSNDPLPILEIAEQMPEFIGGDSPFFNFTSNNFKYPESARQLGIQGKALAEIIIDENGIVKNPPLLRGISSDIDKEILRVINLLPPFKPGYNAGKPCSICFRFPFCVILNDCNNPFSSTFYENSKPISQTLDIDSKNVEMDSN